MPRRHKTAQALLRILEQVDSRLPRNHIEDAKELVDNDEWLVALELICTQLYEYEVPISQELLRLIEEALQSMDVSTEGWLYLRELVTESS
jgi:hypothetical protein